MVRTACVVSAIALALSAGAAAAQTATADINDRNGRAVGKASLFQTPSGVLIRVSLQGLPPGTHAFHIHAAGRCEPPFETAQGHFNPTGKKHGVESAAGPHAGDMPNLHVPPSGALQVEMLNTAVTLDKGPANSLIGPSGTALVVHADADDYASDPAGNAGDRIACGVIRLDDSSATGASSGTPPR